jgi:hypothetical protein
LFAAFTPQTLVKNNSPDPDQNRAHYSTLIITVQCQYLPEKTFFAKSVDWKRITEGNYEEMAEGH